MGRTHEVLVVLRRNSPIEQWGFSLVGGSDVKAPLIVTKVGFASPADGVLQRGDIITKVGNYDARDIRHQDAQVLFQNAGTNIRVVVQRENTPRQNPSTGSSRTSSYNYSPLSVSPHLSPKDNYSSPSSFSPAGTALTPYYSAPFTPVDNNYFDPVSFLPGGKRTSSVDPEFDVTKQPYRTTPLVLPGAKVKRESGRTESYLRLHPNPAVRAPPHHLDPELLIKQKVTNTVLERLNASDPNKQIVHKQFNSPINLYSEQNVADTIQKQTGASPGARKQVKFNPADSETYRAVQEEQFGELVQEVTVPPQSKVYAPNRSVPAKKAAHHVVNQNPPFAANNLGDADIIQQSGSFKRLMWSVLPEHSY